MTSRNDSDETKQPPAYENPCEPHKDVKNGDDTAMRHLETSNDKGRNIGIVIIFASFVSKLFCFIEKLIPRRSTYTAKLLFQESLHFIVTVSKLLTLLVIIFC